MLKTLSLEKADPLPLLVFVNKGIESGSNKLPLDVIAEVCGDSVAEVATFLVSQASSTVVLKGSDMDRCAERTLFRQGDCQAPADAGVRSVQVDQTRATDSRAFPPASVRRTSTLNSSHTTDIIFSAASDAT